jgi:hypothetical protein
MGHGFAIGLLLVGAAQVPAAETIARQLESSDARTVAWGAYNAGAYHRDDMIPRLQRILESGAMSPETEGMPFRAETIATVRWSTAAACCRACGNCGLRSNNGFDLS